MGGNSVMEMVLKMVLGTRYSGGDNSVIVSTQMDDADSLNFVTNAGGGCGSQAISHVAISFAVVVRAG
jgi:hypothetical protein